MKIYTIKDERVIVGPAIGEDAAITVTGGPRHLFAKTDPITFTTDHIGWYAVHINANDIATMGGRPQWFLATLLLLENHTSSSQVEKILQDIFDACLSPGITLVGGHTEITFDPDCPIIAGQMLGEVEKEKLVRTNGAREGDAIILMKGIAVEGTAMLARQRKKRVAGILGPEAVKRCLNFIYRPAPSVSRDAESAVRSADVRSMHDPTEGGLATVLQEIGWAAGVGMVVDAQAIPVFLETLKLCELYGLDPTELIASGALPVIVGGAEGQKVIAGLAARGIEAALIGHVVHQGEGIRIRTASGLHELPIFEQDELTKLPG